MAEKPLRADARRNRERVLRTAQQVFAAEGLGVSLDEIARRAGVGPGTVHRHFPAKEALYLAVAIDEIEHLVAEAEMLRALEAKGVRTPAPLQMNAGQMHAGSLDMPTVGGKPVAVFPWRAGGMRCQASVTVEDARRVGAELARVHVAGEGVAVGEGRFRIEDLVGRIDVIRGAADREERRGGFAFASTVLLAGISIGVAMGWFLHAR